MLFSFFFLIVFVCIILFRTTCNNCNGRTHRNPNFFWKKKKKKVQFNLDNGIQIYCIEIKLKLLFNISRNVKINNIINLLSNYKKNHDSSIIAKESNAEVKG